MGSEISYIFANPNDVWKNLPQMREALSRQYAGEIELIHGADSDKGKDTYRAEGRFQNSNFSLIGLDIVRRVDIWGSEQGRAEIVQALEKIVGIKLIEGKPVGAPPSN